LLERNCTSASLPAAAAAAAAATPEICYASNAKEIAHKANAN